MRFFITALIFLTASCQTQTGGPEQAKEPIVGTWELISATTIQGDSTHHNDLSNQRMIKIINESHFSFLNHDLNKGQDSLASFTAGGGRYTLEKDQYTEFLEYCSYRPWEGHTFEFTVEVKGDTLTQTGIEKIEELGVDRHIIEVYVKANE